MRRQKMTKDLLKSLPKNASKPMGETTQTHPWRYQAICLCRPIIGWRSRHLNRPAKVNRLQKADAAEDLPMEIPCGQCVGCRLERSRRWAIRCTHEASLQDDNFLTLTYNDENYKDGSL